MNVALLRKVQAAILKHPDQFEMGGWFASLLVLGDSGYETMLPAGGCGTAACIAGWAKHLALGLPTLAETYRKQGQLFTASHAKELLGLTAQQAERLFYSCDWPGTFADQYHSATSLKGRARTAARRIDHFIKTKGAE